MVSALKWEGTSSATDITPTGLNSLTDNTLTSASTEVNNSTGLNTYYWLELNVTMNVSASDAAPTIDVYISQAPDGTNYDTAPVTGGTNCGEQYVGSFSIRTGTSAQRIVIGPFAMHPHKQKFYLDNQTGESTTSSGHTLDILTNNLEGQ